MGDNFSNLGLNKVSAISANTINTPKTAGVLENANISGNRGTSSLGGTSNLNAGVSSINTPNNGAAGVVPGDNLKELKKDTVIIGGKEIKKKTAIMAAAATILTIGGIAAGIFFAIRRRQAPGGGSAGGVIEQLTGGRKPRVPDNAVVLDSMPGEIGQFDKVARKAISEAEATVSIANKTRDDAIALSERVKKALAEVQDLFDTKATHTKDGRRVDIITTKKGKTIIKEFAQDGKRISRKSTFRTDKPEINIEEYVSKTKRNLITAYKDKDITLYAGGVEALSDGVKKYDCKLDLYKGRPAFYASGCVDLGRKEGGKYTYKKAVDFIDFKDPKDPTKIRAGMQAYYEGYTWSKEKEEFAKKLEFNPNGAITVKKKDASGKVITKKGKPVTEETHGQVLTGYYKGLTKYADGREESPISIAFMTRPGSPGKHYIEGYEKSAEGNTRCKKSISYDRFKNKPVEYVENTQYGVGKWDKNYKFECGQWYMIPPEN